MSTIKVFNVVNDDDMYICMSSQSLTHIKTVDVAVDDDILMVCRRIERRSLIIIKIIKCICRDVFVLLVGAFKIAPLLTKAHTQHMTLARTERKREEGSLNVSSGQGGQK